MGSSKRQTTMAKLARERAVKEKRELKAERKEERKAAAARAEAGEDVLPAQSDPDETPGE